jgi:hypothetical protein
MDASSGPTGRAYNSRLMANEKLRSLLLGLLAEYKTLLTENHAMSRVLDEDRHCNWKQSYHSYREMAQQSVDADAAGLEEETASGSDPLSALAAFLKRQSPIPEPDKPR